MWRIEIERMEEKIVKVVVLLLLLINGILDLRKCEVSLICLGVFGIAGISFNVWFGYQTVQQIVGGVGVGILLLFLAFFTKEAIGFGDGLLTCVTGIYLGFWENLSLLFWGAVCSAVVLGVALMMGRIKMEDRAPLVPFLLLAFVGRLIL